MFIGVACLRLWRPRSLSRFPSNHVNVSGAWSSFSLTNSDLAALALTEGVGAGALFFWSHRNAHLSSTLRGDSGLWAGAFNMSWLSKLCFAGGVLACAVTWVGDSAISVSLRQEQQTECGDVALIVVGDVASHLGSLNDAQERLNLRTLSWQSCM